MRHEKKEVYAPRTNIMTQSTFERLQNELVELEKQVENMNRQIGESAGDTHDWHDNFAYDQAIRDSQLAEKRLRDLKKALVEPEIIQPRENTEDVGIGNLVKVLYEGEIDEEEYTILGQFDSGTYPSWISYNSPLGESILGRKRNDVVDLLVNERQISVMITDIQPGRFSKDES